MPQPPDFRYDVFLSHNSGDKPRVRRLAERLKAAGLKVWFDEWVIRPGDDIYLAIERGLEAARVQVLCLSPTALGSNWVALERSTVLFRDPGNAGRRFIPLLLSDCELPDALRRYKHVDFREEAEAAFEELLSACRPATEVVPEAPSPVSAETARPTGRRKPVESKRVAEPPGSRPGPKEKKPEQGKPPEETEPLAVLERKLTGHTGWVYSVAISPDGTWVVSGSQDGTVKIWDLETGACRLTLRGHESIVTSVAITPDGKRILSGAFDDTVRLWDASSGRELAKLVGHTRGLRSVVALQDNARALSGGLDDSFRLWNLASGTCLKTIRVGEESRENSPDDVTSIAANGQGTEALSGHRNGRIRLWDLEKSECLATLKGHSGIVKRGYPYECGRRRMAGWQFLSRHCNRKQARTTVPGHKFCKKLGAATMRPGDSAISLEGCSCEVENHVVFCWPFTISLSSNRLHAVAPYRGFKSNEHGRCWPSPMANASRPWPFRCNVSRPRSGGCVGAMKRRGWRVSWPRGRARGIPSRFPPLQRAQIVRLACLEPIAKGLHITHWNSQDLAREAVVEGIVPSISARTVRRILHEVDLQPHRTRYWKTPHLDTQFKQRTEKILWCYAYAERLVPRGFWIVCVDEMPNLQVLERTPIRRAIPGSIEQQEFEYTRHGTVNVLLFLIVHSGRMEATCPARKDAEHYIQALQQFRSRHRHLRGVFLIQDGDPSHTAATTTGYFNSHPWWRPRFTPVHTSWLNQAELLNDAFSYRYLKRCSWHSRQELIDHIDAAWPEYNQLYAHPFEWTWTNQKMRQWFAEHTTDPP